MKYWRAYSQLTKSGIILFTLVSALAGYAISYQFTQEFELLQPILLMVGLYLASAAGFAINQAQEWRNDTRMNRTKGRPIPMGIITVWQAYTIGILFSVVGLLILAALGSVPCALTALTLFLYNVIYTLFWKRRWVFGAVPGAIPGAMPVVIGYSVNSTAIFSPECVYLFLVMFLWQMPHFWSLAIRFREDYESGGFPVLPVSLGVNRALYHIGLYVFAYVGVALMAPLFLRAHVLYVILVVPISLKVVWEFNKFYRDTEQRAWLPFFLWTNLSLLIYLAVPVMDKWISWAMGNYV